VYRGKTADWIRLPFGVVIGLGRGMDALDGSGDRHRGKDSFWGGDTLFPNDLLAIYVALVVVLWRPAMLALSATVTLSDENQ